MTEPSDAGINWGLCTWKGARRKQHQEYHAIPFSRKLEIIEEMNRYALDTLETRRASGLPYIDPYTGERVPGAVVRADAPATTVNPENS